MIPWIEGDARFPPVERALREPNGLLAAGADLSPARLIDAYRRGIFPWFGDDSPPLWWSPDPRMVLFVDEFHLSRSLQREIRSGRFRISTDKAFPDVMAGCAGPRDGETGTWVTTAMIDAYSRLAAMGYAHSVETWAGDTLVGGLYGVAIGRMFFGESMFSRRSNASKVAFACLVRQLRRWGFPLIDCQLATSHLSSLGAREIRRTDFTERVSRLVVERAVPSPWDFDRDLWVQYEEGASSPRDA